MRQAVRHRPDEDAPGEHDGGEIVPVFRASELDAGVPDESPLVLPDRAAVRRQERQRKIGARPVARSQKVEIKALPCLQIYPEKVHVARRGEAAADHGRPLYRLGGFQIVVRLFLLD